MDFKLSRSPSSPLSGWIGTLGGIYIQNKTPKSHLNQAEFYSRKGYYALPVQAMVDSNYIVLCYSAKYVGSVHDSLANSASNLGMYLDERKLLIEVRITADGVYICNEALITPCQAS